MEYNQLVSKFNNKEFFINAINIQITLNIVEITIPLKHTILRAESKADTLYAAVDFATDKVERQLLRHKQKVSSMMKKRDGIGNYFSQIESAEERKEPLEVSKTKVIEKEVMSVDEAILQMELLDHDFFMFIKNGHIETQSAK